MLIHHGRNKEIRFSPVAEVVFGNNSFDQKKAYCLGFILLCRRSAKPVHAITVSDFALSMPAAAAGEPSKKGNGGGCSQSGPSHESEQCKTPARTASCLQSDSGSRRWLRVSPKLGLVPDRSRLQVARHESCVACVLPHSWLLRCPLVQLLDESRHIHFGLTGSVVQVQG